MTTIKRILHATDFSPASEPAWTEARRLGRLFDAEIVVVHAIAPPILLPAEGYFPPQLYDELVESARRGAQEGFDRLLASAPGAGLKTRTRLVEGPPAQRILEVVTEVAADLLVVGTHGRTGLERVMVGSVADRLLRQASCPVLTVRSALTPDPGTTLRRLCYATDFSPTARAAWPFAVAIATAASAVIDLVHVTFAPVPDRHLSPETIGRMAQLLHEQGRADVERFLAGTTFPRERVRMHLTHGVTGEQIVHRAREHGSDLIVMGTHGRSGAVRWMLGSVAQQVIQTAPCPVLTVAPVAAAAEARPSAGAR
jgi:nucleotide-binding universal stress UspA family protein